LGQHVGLLHHIFFQTTRGQHFYVFIHLLSRNIQIMCLKSQMLVKNVGHMLVPLANHNGHNNNKISQQNKEDQQQTKEGSQQNKKFTTEKRRFTGSQQNS